MKRKTVSGIVLTLMLISASIFVFNTQSLKGIIYIKASESGDPQTGKLFGIVYDDSVNKLALVDSETGELTTVSSFPSLTLVVCSVSALDATSHRYFFIAMDSAMRLFTVDTQTGLVVASPVISYEFSSLEFDYATGRLLGVAYIDGVNKLVVVNSGTGETTTLGSFPSLTAVQALSALDVAGNRYFFVASDPADRLFTVDIETGTVVANPLISYQLSSIEFDYADGRLFGVAYVDGANKLVAVNTETGELTAVGSFPSLTAVSQALSALDAITNRYFFIAMDTIKRLFAVDTETATVVTSPVIPYDFSSLEFMMPWLPAIYIRADGSIDPPTAPIQRNGDLYTFIDNIISDGIVIERSNIVVDGSGYTVQGLGAYDSKGINLTGISNVTIMNMEIKAFGDGVCLDSSSGNTVSENNVTNNGYGIYLYEFSNNNSIIGNNIAANRYYGIKLDSSSGNSINGNNVTDNGRGICLYCSCNNTSIIGNTFINDSLDVWSSYQNLVKDNTVNGKPLVYQEGVVNSSVDDAGQVILVNCDSIRVEGLNLSRGDICVQLWNTNNSIISGNNIINNDCGVWLSGSSNNFIIGNNIKNNGFGIGLSGSSNSEFYHNNFIDNARQVYTESVNVWDDGYPSGGNYWSDYAGADLYCGLYQNETGCDGIGDTPYIIDVDNKDNYPLTKPYGGPVDIGIANLTTSKTVVGQGYNLNVTVKIINYGINTETFNITVYANTTIIATSTNITLTTRNSTTITFTWNTTDFVKGNYTISTNITQVLGETDTTDNMLIDSVVLVGVPCDVTGPEPGVPDGVCNMRDIGYFCQAFITQDPNCDVTGPIPQVPDGTVNMRDIGEACNNFMKT